jgi:hypothetical protein
MIPPRRCSPTGLLAFALLAFVTPVASAQGPPRLPDATQRSGLITRYSPIIPRLPHDKDRDDYYITRWSEPDTKHPNLYPQGMYGLKWNRDCTSCNNPFFRGFPGPNCVNGKCLPAPRSHRLWDNFIHPYRPVGYYYAGGCAVPIYDLDPLVTGPGPFPWNVFFKRPEGG